MAKKKQPYIPLYTGDYIKDTRTLSLEAKGAWSDLILFMWVNESKGVLEGTSEDFARMVGTSEQNFVDVLKELCRKKICDVSGPTDGVFKIICRRLVREAEISSKRSEAVQTRYKTSTNDTTKTLQKSDNDIDNDNGIEDDNFKYELKKIEEKVDDMETRLTLALDEIYIDGQRMKWSHVDFDIELMGFQEKVRGSPNFYKDYDNEALRLAFQKQLRGAKKKSNGFTSNKGISGQGGPEAGKDYKSGGGF